MSFSSHINNKKKDILVFEYFSKLIFSYYIIAKRPSRIAVCRNTTRKIKLVTRIDPD